MSLQDIPRAVRPYERVCVCDETGDSQHLMLVNQRSGERVFVGSSQKENFRIKEDTYTMQFYVAVRVAWSNGSGTILTYGCAALSLFRSQARPFSGSAQAKQSNMSAWLESKDSRT